MSRYLSLGDGLLLGDGGAEARHRWIKVWRRGFMRCRIRDGPWGSHQEEARAEKWDISVSETVDAGRGDGDDDGPGLGLGPVE